MALVDRTKVRRGGLAAIAAAVVVTAFAVVSAVPPWAVAPPTSSMAGASMQGQSLDACSDILTNLQGFLLDIGGFTTIEVPGASATLVQGINNRGQIVGIYGDDPEHDPWVSAGQR